MTTANIGGSTGASNTQPTPTPTPTPAPTQPGNPYGASSAGTQGAGSLGNDQTKLSDAQRLRELRTAEGGALDTVISTIKQEEAGLQQLAQQGKITQGQEQALNLKLDIIKGELGDVKDAVSHASAEGKTDAELKTELSAMQQLQHLGTQVATGKITQAQADATTTKEKDLLENPDADPAATGGVQDQGMAEQINAVGGLANARYQALASNKVEAGKQADALLALAKGVSFKGVTPAEDKQIQDTMKQVNAAAQQLGNGALSADAFKALQTKLEALPGNSGGKGAGGPVSTDQAALEQDRQAVAADKKTVAGDRQAVAEDKALQHVYKQFGDTKAEQDLAKKLKTDEQTLGKDKGALKDARAKLKQDDGRLTKAEDARERQDETKVKTDRKQVARDRSQLGEDQALERVYKQYGDQTDAAATAKRVTQDQQALTQDEAALKAARDQAAKDAPGGKGTPTQAAGGPANPAAAAQAKVKADRQALQDDQQAIDRDGKQLQSLAASGDQAKLQKAIAALQADFNRLEGDDTHYQQDEKALENLSNPPGSAGNR